MRKVAHPLIFQKLKILGRTIMISVFKNIAYSQIRNSAVKLF